MSRKTKQTPVKSMRKDVLGREWLLIGGILIYFVLTCALTLGADEQSAAWHFRHASDLAQEGQLDEAEREYRLGLKISPSPEAYNNLGAIYFGRQRFAEAMAAFRQAHLLKPNNPEFSFNLGLALYKAGDSAAAVPHLIAGVRSPDHGPDAHYLLGACYFDLEQWQRSINELDLARKGGFSGAETLFLLVYAYRKVGKPEKSVEAAIELLRNYPNSPLAHDMLGEAHDSATEPRQAEEEFKKAIAASPRAPRLHFLLGYLYWKWKHYEEAKGPLQQEVLINPGFPPCYFYLGDIALRQGETDHALVYFEEARRFDPSYGDAYLGIGRAYVNSGRPQDAIPLFRRAAQLLPGRVEPHQWLGRTLMRIGHVKEGQQELAEVERINSTQRQRATEIFRKAASEARLGSTAVLH